MQKEKETRLIGLRAYLRFLRPHWHKLAFVLGLFTIANILIALIPVFIGQLVQTLSENPIDSSRGWMFAWILVALSSFHDIFWRCSEFAYRGFITKITYDFETYLFRAVISRPYPYFVNKLTGKVGAYILTISNEFRNLLGNVMFDSSGQLVGLIATMLILGSLNWQTGLVFISGIIGMFFVGRFTLAYNMKYEAKATDISSTKNGILHDAIANYGSVKAFHSDARESSTIAMEQNKAFIANQKAFLSGIIFWTSMSFFVRHLMWPIIILMNVHFFFENEITIGQLATLLSTVLIFSSTIWASIWQVSQFGQQMARVNEAYEHLFGLETTLDVSFDSHSAQPEFKEKIVLNNISFAYPDKPDQKVLDSISLSIKRGEKVGIVGRSGGGKSTLTKLLLDFYPITDGTLLVDDKRIDHKSFAKLISYVPQDTALFHRSIQDNISYGTDKTDINQVVEAAKLASADEFIAQLPDGYKTLVGERGIKLSGGQRQRIAIARALLQDKPILVLDEATSALDSESEQKIQEGLNTLWEGKTVIAIAHRLSTLRHMDKIVVIDQGAIVEQGTHKELVEKGGIYADLWSHQSGGFIEE